MEFSARKVAFLFIVLQFFCLTSVYALDQSGQSAGKLLGSWMVNKLNDPSKMQERILNPANQQSPVRTLDDSQTGSFSMNCIQTSTGNLTKILSITINVQQTGASINICLDLSGTGMCQAQVSIGGVKMVCQKGYMDTNNSYYKFEVTGSGSSISINRVPVPSLDGCVAADSFPSPELVGAYLAEQIASKVNMSLKTVKVDGMTASYYIGDEQVCTQMQANGQPQSQSTSELTSMYANPYDIPGRVENKLLGCSSDASCSVYQSLSNAFNSSPPSTITCTITKTIIDPPDLAKPYDNVCEPDKIYYPDGYSITNQYCLSNPSSRWDYNSQFIIRCSSNGKKMYLNAWAFWEGAPCNGSANHPPHVQIEAEIPWGPAPTSVNVGKLSVNRRVGGDNLTSSDMGASTECYSTMFPLEVTYTSQCSPDLTQCTYTFNTANINVCNTFTFTLVRAPQQEINDECQAYSQGASNFSCKLINEKWFDAFGSPHLIIQDGQTVGSTPVPTCRNTLSYGHVCSSWWSIEREYSCTTSTADTDINNATNDMKNTFSGLLGSASYNENTGQYKWYLQSQCSSNPDQCKGFIDTQATTGPECQVTCLISFPKSPSQGDVTQKEYALIDCVESGGQYICPGDPAHPNATVEKNCGCLNTSAQPLSVLGGIYEALHKDRVCAN